ncbi:MAG: hemolysin III family protein [Kiritimatiellaeota bacterium]|nr:hemolysin III family protein [Kiritimatiellota bacterium]
MPGTSKGLNADRSQTMGEEIANAITHGVGAVLSLGCFGVAVAFAAARGDAWRIVSASIYGFMMFLMYLSSTMYHAAVWPPGKRILNIIDHNAIYLMIAGSYTPFCLVALRQHSPAWGWSVFGAIWAFALAGIVLQSLFIHRFRVLSTLTYVLMGWTCIIAVYPLWKAMGTMGVLGIGAGGLLYTAGVVFYVLKHLKYTHAVWHLFVLGGSMVHFFTILFCVMLPEAP